MKPGAPRIGAAWTLAADGLDGNVRGRLAGAGRAERRVDQVGDLVDLRDEVLRIDVVRRLGDGRASRSRLAGAPSVTFSGKRLRLEDAAVRRVQDVGVELVVVAVGVDVVAGDLRPGAGAVVDEAHGVALVDELEAGALQRPVVVAREDEEVVLGGQAVEREGVGRRSGLVPMEAMSRSAFLLRKIGAGDAVLQMQIGRRRPSCRCPSGRAAAGARDSGG